MGRLARIQQIEDVFGLSKREGSHGGWRCWGAEIQVQSPLYMTSHMTLLICVVAVLIYQQNHVTLHFLNDRDKTVAMILPDINGHISAKNRHYVILTISSLNYETGASCQIFSEFSQFYFLRYSLINPGVQNIATVLSPTVHYIFYPLTVDR